MKEKVFKIRTSWEFVEDVEEISNVPWEESVEFDDLTYNIFTDMATMQICIIRQGDKYGLYTLDHTYGFGGPGTFCNPSFNPFPYDEVKCYTFPSVYYLLAFRIGDKWGIIKVVSLSNQEEGVYDVEYGATKRKIIVPCKYSSLADAEFQLGVKYNWKDPFKDNMNDNDFGRKQNIGISLYSINPINFKLRPLHDTVVDALQFICIQELSDFDLKPEFFNVPERGIHDSRHIYRVMIASALIAHKLNEPRLGLLAFCGAFIHDLARRNNGEDNQHGTRAALTKWNMFNALWDKYGLNDTEQSNVRAAVSRHSGGGNAGFQDNRLVNQILHDADALDRCRFRQHDRLDWKYLSLPQLKCTDDHPSQMLKTLIGETEAICGFTKYLQTFIPFQDFLENIR